MCYINIKYRSEISRNMNQTRNKYIMYVVYSILEHKDIECTLTVFKWEKATLQGPIKKTYKNSA